MVALFIIIFFTIPLLVLFISSRFGGKPYPPGPKGWPLIGNLNMISQLTHRGLAALSKQYGGIFHLRMGSRHLFVVSNPDAARQVLQVHDIITSNKPANLCMTYLSYDRADLAFANYGPFWRRMRKLCVTKLFSRNRAEPWASVEDRAGGMIRRVASAAGAGAAVNVGELLFEFSRSFIYRAAFGSSAGDGEDEFMKIMPEFSKLFGALDIGDFIPWLGFVDFHGLNDRLVKARASLDGFIDTVIDDHIHRKKSQEIVERDMVDELLAFYSDDEEEEKAQLAHVEQDSQSHIKLTKNNIKGIIMDMMFGGTETGAFTAEWVMAELMRNPKHLRKVQQELADVAGLARNLEKPDFERLTYFRCCVKEALRLHPPIPLLLHETAADITVSGSHIPAKSRVTINVWAMGHDATVWENPEEFDPSRFLKHGAPDFKGSNFEFLPFGSGRRSCPGMQLGLYAVEMAAALLLHCFTWELPDGVEPRNLDMSDVFGLTAARAERLVAVPTPRLLCAL